MLLVKSIPNNNHDVSSTIVQSVNWHIPDQKGFWGSSGSKSGILNRTRQIIRILFVAIILVSATTQGPHRVISSAHLKY